jgi:tetratricopeptide (TPR) repeat protein
MRPLKRFVLLFLATTAIAAAPTDPIQRGAATIRKLEEQVAQEPDSERSLVTLVEAYLNQARLTGDGDFYRQAQRAVDRLAKLRPNSWEVFTLSAWVVSGEHRFAEAVKLSKKALEESPHNSTNLGILADAYTELGQYAEADQALEDMATHKPGPSAYLRVAYARTLRGDLAGADALLNDAVASTQPESDPELAAWLATQKGDLECMRGNAKAALVNYEAALHWVAGYANAVGPLARVLATQGQLERAATLLNEALARRPSAELAGTLEDVERARGRPKEAELAAGAVEAMVALMGATGITLDRSIARVDADHSRKLERAHTIATAEFKGRPSVYSADVLAWVLFRQGHSDQALVYSTKALAIGTPEPLFAAHHGLILNKLGKKPQAKPYLETALKNGIGLDLGLRAEVKAALGGKGR